MLMSEELKVLENKHCIGILLALRDGSMTKMELYNRVSKNPRMPDKMADLESIGLLTVTKTDSRADCVALTDKGSEVADMLVQIDSLLMER